MQSHARSVATVCISFLRRTYRTVLVPKQLLFYYEIVVGYVRERAS
jgi:hypothetical protein